LKSSAELGIFGAVSRSACAVVALVAAMGLSAPASAALGYASRATSDPNGWWRTLSTPRPLSALTWLTEEFQQRSDHRIGAEHELAMCVATPIRRPSGPASGVPLTGRYGFSTVERRQAPEPNRARAAPVRLVRAAAVGARVYALPDPLDTGGADIHPWAIDAVPEPVGIELLPLLRAQQRGSWSRLARHGLRSPPVSAARCDGSIALEALIASAIARPPGTPHPGLPLPLEPELSVMSGEWVPACA
jgi:hypothetical protein